jgi:hypothetical protein
VERSELSDYLDRCREELNPTVGAVGLSKSWQTATRNASAMVATVKGP